MLAGDVDAALRQLGAARLLVLHIHWLNALFKDCKSDASAWQIVNDFIQGVDALRDGGAKIMWTIHNHTEHENPFAEQDLRIRYYLCKFADRIHLHCASHIGELSYLPLALEKIVIHRHGSYIGYYDAFGGKFSIDKRIREIKGGGLRALFLGALRGYKGINSLLQVAEDLVASGVEVTIAGDPANESIRAQLESFAARVKVKTILRRLTEQEVGELCLQHNVGILSYDKILTSGTLKLYLGYGMVVVAPDLPTITAEDRYHSFIKLSGTKGGKGIGRLLVTKHRDELADAAIKNYLLAQESRWSAELFEF